MFIIQTSDDFSKKYIYGSSMRHDDEKLYIALIQQEITAAMKETAGVFFRKNS